mgnify:CR=1 FL=1
MANGRLLWDDGKVENPIKLDLGGRYRADIEGDKDGNALTVELLSEETAVVLSGDIFVEPEGDYKLEVFVKPSGTADPSIGAALEFIGAPQNDGSVHGTRAHDKTGRHCPADDPNGKLDISRCSGYWLLDENGKQREEIRHICWDGCMFPNEALLKQQTWNTILEAMQQVNKAHG